MENRLSLLSLNHVPAPFSDGLLERIFILLGTQIPQGPPFATGGRQFRLCWPSWFPWWPRGNSSGQLRIYMIVWVLKYFRHYLSPSIKFLFQSTNIHVLHVNDLEKRSSFSWSYFCLSQGKTTHTHAHPRSERNQYWFGNCTLSEITTDTAIIN